MTKPPVNPIQKLFDQTNRWLRDTPERALDQAYDAAVRIQGIEIEHFQGGKIARESGEQSDRVFAYFNSELQKNLKIIQMRLMIFNASRSVMGFAEPSSSRSLNSKADLNGSQPNSLKRSDAISQICEKLEFIDSVINKYNEASLQNSSTSSLLNPDEVKLRFFDSLSSSKASQSNPDSQERSIRDIQMSSGSAKLTKEELKVSSETSVLPRSLLRTLNRIQRELKPESEEEVLKNYRKSKLKTIISIRFILLLILIPLLTQQLAKNFIVGPIVDQAFMRNESTPIFLNLDMQEEAFVELQRYEERLKFEMLIGLTPQLSQEEREEKVKEKALEIAEEFKAEGSNSIKNVFSDIISILTFGLIIYKNRREVDILKSFMGDVIYGLSDSAKAFIIILLTDMFVGFHSPHGWEVILESMARHLGLPENRDFNFLFIATFPVILDAVFKYWIFRYLNRSSPSAVSTYKTMNE